MTIIEYYRIYHKEKMHKTDKRIGTICPATIGIIDSCKSGSCYDCFARSIDLDKCSRFVRKNVEKAKSHRSKIVRK